MRWVALDYRLANVMGYAVGCGLGFLLNRVWTFGDKGPWRGSLARWLGVVGTGWGLNLLIVVLLHSGLGIDAYVAQFGGLITYTGATFLGARFIAFHPPRQLVMDARTA